MYCLHCTDLYKPCVMCCFFFYLITELRQGWPVNQTNIPLPHNSIFISLHGKDKQRRSTYTFIRVLHSIDLPRVLGLGLHAAYSVWAAGKAWGYSTVQTDSWYCETIVSYMCRFCLSLSVAFWGDIALDEEDMRSFKVDRIIDLAQRTVHAVNHTDTGNGNRNSNCSKSANLR